MERLEQNEKEMMGGERIYPKSFNEAALDHKERYQLALNYIAPNAQVLDAACGAGYGSNYLAVNSRCEMVTGLDVNEHALAWAEEYFKSEKNIFLKADLLSDFSSLLPVKQFDVITSFETIEHLREDHTFLKQIFKLLKPGGVFLISSPNEEVIPCLQNPYYVGGKNPHHHRHYRPSELKTILQECGFTIIEQYSQTPNHIIRGENGFVILYVCTNVPTYQPYSMNSVEQAIEKLNVIKMQMELSFLENEISRSIPYVSIQNRIDELFTSCEQLISAFDLIDKKELQESQRILESIDKSLCPESYYWLGLVYQTQGQLFKAMEVYSKLIDKRLSTNDYVIEFAEEQLLEVINRLIKP